MLFNAIILPTSFRIIAAAEPDNYLKERNMRNNRNRAWRRFQDRVHNGNGMGSAALDKPEKNWKLMYFRKNKLIRAKQLGFDYPIKNQMQLLDQELATDE